MGTVLFLMFLFCSLFARLCRISSGTSHVCRLLDHQPNPRRPRPGPFLRNEAILCAAAIWSPHRCFELQPNCSPRKPSDTRGPRPEAKGKRLFAAASKLLNVVLRPQDHVSRSCGLARGPSRAAVFPRICALSRAWFVVALEFSLPCHPVRWSHFRHNGGLICWDMVTKSLAKRWWILAIAALYLGSA